MRLFLLFIMYFLAGLVHAAPTAPPTLLDIDSGGHKAIIRDVAFTPDGRSLVSAGEDKVIRVWDIASGQTVRTLRGQSGEGDEGKIYAMALSPNGQWLAVGGWMKENILKVGHSIRLYDFNTGEVVAVLPGHEDVVSSLAFSPDNRYLVSGSADKTAIVWDVAQRQLLHRLTGHTKEIYAVAFTSDSQRVVTGSYDHDLRLWSVQGQLLQTLTGHKDEVYAVAVSLQYIASGSKDNTIRLWHSKTGKFIKELANQGTHIGSLSFSPDGQYLVSGVGGGGPNEYCHVWSVPKGKEIITYQRHDNIVLATAVSPDGQWVATGGGSNHEIHLWSLRDGKLNKRLTGGGVATWAVGFSADGQQLAWGNQPINQTNQAGKLEYQLTLPTPQRPLGEPQLLKSDKNFVRAQPQSQERVLRTRADEKYGYQAILEVYQDQHVTAWIERDTTNGSRHLAYTFTPDGNFIISGGSGGVLTKWWQPWGDHPYDLKGQKLGDYVGHTGDIRAVAVSPDGQLLASGGHDQTVRLWSVATRENLLTVFRSKNGEWVAWTPSGYYAASAKGDSMVGWQINQGADKAADYVTAAQLRQHFYRPDIVTNTVLLRNEQLALNQAQLQPFQLSQLNQALPPKFQIITPESEAHTKVSQLPMRLSFAANAEPIQAIEIYSNDRLVLTRKIALPELKDSVPQDYSVPLFSGLNQLRVVARNRIGETVEQLNVYLNARNALEDIGDLYLVAIGVSKYREEGKSLKSLNYAANDAREMVELLRQQQGKLYEKVHTTLLADGATPPTAENIRTALGNMTQPPIRSNDTVILFLAGHGVNNTVKDDKDEWNYFFLPQDVETERLRDTAIPWTELQKALQNAPGRRILLVDTCYSGNVLNLRLVNDTVHSRIMLISAANENTRSRELPGLNHGVFTFALLEGLQGKADTGGNDKLVKVHELTSYLLDRMEELTGGLQTPVLKCPDRLQKSVLTKIE